VLSVLKSSRLSVAHIVCPSCPSQWRKLCCVSISSFRKCQLQFSITSMWPSLTAPLQAIPSRWKKVWPCHPEIRTIFRCSTENLNIRVRKYAWRLLNRKVFELPDYYHHRCEELNEEFDRNRNISSVIFICPREAHDFIHGWILPCNNTVTVVQVLKNQWKKYCRANYLPHMMS